jgi:tetratricopeptide (TPR) repeat protein
MRDPRPPDARATIIYNEAELEEDVGDLVAAERLNSQAIDIWSRGLGADHPFVAHGIDALAQVVAKRGQLMRARTLYTRALAIRRKALGPAHPQVAWTLANLAATEMDARDYATATRHIDEAIALYAWRCIGRAGSSRDACSNYAASSRQRVAILVPRGERGRSADRARTRVRPCASADTETRAALARVDLMRGDASRAVEEALTAERNGRDHLRYTLRYLPERQALAYAGRRTRALDVLLSSGIADPAARVTALDELVQSRGVLLDEFAARARTTATPDSNLRDFVKKRSRRGCGSPISSCAACANRSIVSSSTRHASARKKPSARLPHAAPMRALKARRTAAGIREVREALPPGTAVVVLRPLRTSAAHLRVPYCCRRPSYGAFVVRPDAPLSDAVFVRWIGRDDRAADSRMEGSLVAATAAGEGRIRSASTEKPGGTARAIWDPIVPHLGAAVVAVHRARRAAERREHRRLAVAQRAAVSGRGVGRHALPVDRT